MTYQVNDAVWLEGSRSIYKGFVDKVVWVFYKVRFKDVNDRWYNVWVLGDTSLSPRVL